MKRFGKATPSAKPRGGNHLQPTTIANFAVTYRCNGRCTTCSIWKIEDPGRGEMTLGEIRDLFELNKSFLSEVRSIQITGGEPFTRDDLPELVSTIRRCLPRCSFWIPTNGMAPGIVEEATRAILKGLGGEGLGVSVSIDGLGRTHDSVRGFVGSFERAVETLRRLSAVRGEYPSLGLAVGMTVTPENFRDLHEVFALARSHGAGFSLRPVNFSRIYYRNIGGAFSMEGDAEELLPLIQGIGREILRGRGPIASAPTLRYMQGVMDFVRDPGRRRLRCSAGSDSLFLDPYGNVYPCIFLDVRMGNALESPMEEIWGSEDASRARRMAGRGECPGCWVECEAFRDIRRDAVGLALTAMRAILHPHTSGIS